jgi:6-phosphogluconolactonase
MHVHVFDGDDSLAAAAADRVAAIVSETVARRNGCAMVLSGGSTPRALYGRLARPPHRYAPWWQRVDLFWSDERAVPPDHAESNYRMARETLIDPLSLAEARVHRMRGEAADLGRAADQYEQELRSVVIDSSGGMPVLDLVLLGLGTDGHTASLFPGSPALHVADRAVTVTDVPGIGRRLTLTFPALLAARAILVLVSGSAKAPAVDATFHAALDPDRWPAQRLREGGTRVVWLLDRAVAPRKDYP